MGAISGKSPCRGEQLLGACARRYCHEPWPEELLGSHSESSALLGMRAPAERNPTQGHPIAGQLVPVMERHAGLALAQLGDCSVESSTCRSAAVNSPSAPSCFVPFHMCLLPNTPYPLVSVQSPFGGTQSVRGTGKYCTAFIFSLPAH